ncbi:alpha-L-arabinofuranosidase C-terminal domain-containing protein [Pedobacter cryophilus]|uniref:non-reducing end alpha-L-arabinofuranosidase n=1 Tax=Pedobacter cryophilus TaxID=2571271 RepID=A0A4U1BSY7_9SPHI|nr:alpha-L-arabinofuranosidase C-terminal domain-containing protein [Pedobacter cryophilus]TKB95228.1 alpha-L-arabinofuranosidase [Pedobacter cryophilus]
MKKSVYLFCSILLICGLSFQSSEAQQSFTVKANQLKAPISPTMWGVFFEDINMGADGGIYAELIKNRSFEFYKPLMGWAVEGKKSEGDILVLNRQGANTSNPRFLRVNVNEANNISIINEGFRGMGIKAGLRYDFSFMYRQAKPGVKLYLELLNEKNEVIGKGESIPSGSGSNWDKQSVSFNATATAQKAKFKIRFEGNGVVDLDMISLFPSDTWKGRPGGMRSDMVQLLADMKPGFIRFPGGCIVEGHDLATRYQWKKTIGPLENRELIVNRWNTEFAHRPTPDYYQTFGLGFFEYFQLADDIGAEPLPILNCGMACQFNTAELVPIDQLQPYVQDALDLIEFANGDVNSTWGRVRAEMGHPKPFNLKMLGVGNENWGPQYLERLKIFTKAIKDKYPNIKLVNSSGTDPDGDRFNLLNTELRKMNADIIDEHYYRKPEWFLQNVSRYDNYPRNGPKIFAGEYAAQSDKIVSVNNKNNLQTAISEAAFMTGLERNADVVIMASYAPLFAHVDAWQWTPDMIWVDNLQAYGTPNYFVQKLYSTNIGTHVVPLLNNNKTALIGDGGIFASSVVDKKTNELILKIVNTSDKEAESSFNVEGVNKLPSKANLTVLTSNNLGDVNSISKPSEVVPNETQIAIKGKTVKLKLAANSFSVLRVKML